MSPLGKEDAPIPVFVFLDENIAGLNKAVGSAFKRWGNFNDFELFVFPFPNSEKKKKDWQVVLYLRRVIFSPKNYHIRNVLSSGVDFRIILLTLDLNFIKDAQNGFNRSDREWRIHESVIKFDGKHILLKEEDQKVVLDIVSVPFNEKDKRHGLPRVLVTALNDFLNK
ncbi:MAG: hypothetical protein Q7S32_03265 [bacterium]|nr:hypothetical protein [bacterium]